MRHSALRIPSRLNGALVVVYAGLMLAAFALCAQLSGWAFAGLVVGFAILMNGIYSLIHEAEHRMLFTNRRLNDGVGILLALFFPAPFHMIRAGHLHHHRHNRSDNESFDLWFPDENPWWKRLQLYTILTGFFWLCIVLTNLLLIVAPWCFRPKFYGFDRPTRALVAGMKRSMLRLARREAVLVVVAHVAVVWFFAIPLVNYAIMYCGFGLLWSAMQYVHHFGTTRHVTEGARNLRFMRLVDAIWLNHNWHLVHHRYPTLPWIYLPSIGRAECPERGSMVAAYLRMWRGPQAAELRKENHFEGPVSR
jgi:fatty acid desaturase